MTATRRTEESVMEENSENEIVISEDLDMEFDVSKTFDTYKDMRFNEKIASYIIDDLDDILFHSFLFLD